MKDKAKFLLLTYVEILCLQNVAGHKYQQDQGMAGYTCSAASLDIGVAFSTRDCAARCSKLSSCLGFFYSKTDGVCLGTPSIIASTSGCSLKQGTFYFKTSDMTTTTSTTSTTSTTLPSGQYGETCSVDDNCTRAFSKCLQGSCSCKAGYRHESASGSCVANCSTYGSTYIRYQDMDMNVSKTIHVAVLANCFNLCTASSTCRGFTFCCTNACWLKERTPLTDPTEFRPFSGVDYYSRNCV